jgi:hypothetical protein
MTAPSTALGRVYAVLAWLLAALAMLHMATTWRLTSATAFTRLWFFGTGFAMAQTAALNLLHRSYGRTAPGLRWVTRLSNAFILGLTAVGGMVTRAAVGEQVIILAALGLLLALSCVEAATASR